MAHANEPPVDPVGIDCASLSEAASTPDPFAAARRRQRPKLPLDIVAVIFLGGCIGGYARYAISDAWSASRETFPSAILTVNLVGAFILGLVMVLAAELIPNRYLRPLLGTGFCGALTTFSSVVVAAAGIFARHRPAIATGYLIATALSGLVTAACGVLSGRILTRVARSVGVRGRN